MAYTPTNWQNSPSTATPINATNLNKMETGIDEAHDHIADTSAAHLGSAIAVSGFTGNLSGATNVQLALSAVDNFSLGGSNLDGSISQWDFSTSTTMTDPGAGFFRFNAASMTTTTEIVISETDGNAATADELLNRLNVGDELVFIISTSLRASNQWTRFKVDSITDNGTYQTLSVTNVSAGGGALWTNGASIQIESHLNVQGASGLTLEEVQDAVNTMLIVGPGIGKTYNDTAGTLTLTNNAGDQTRDPNYTRTYVFSTETTTTDPTSGFFKLNNASIGSVTTMVISETDGATDSAVNWLDNIKANDILEFSAVSDPTKFWRLNVVSVVDNGTWRTYTVSSGTSGSAGILSISDYVYITRIPSKAVSSVYSGSVAFGIDGAVTTRTGKQRIYNDSGRTRTIVSVRASVNTAPGTTTVIVDVNKNGTTIFGTQANRPTIALSGNTNKSTGHTVTTWEDGAYLTADVDQSDAAASDLSIVVEWS